MRQETFGWRAKIGYVSPAGDWCGGSEYYPLLPDGVAIDIVTLGVQKLQADDIHKVFDKYLPAAKHLAAQECDVIVVAGSIVFTYVGYGESSSMIDRIREACGGVPIINNLDAHFDALRTFKAKKVVLVSPYEPPRNEERKKLLEQQGFQVVGMKGMNLSKRLDIEKLPHYMSYRLSKEAVRASPDCDAVYISCPEWPTIRNIDMIEKDTGKPVVAPVPALIWAALRKVGIKDEIKGYGRLMEML